MAENIRALIEELRNRNLESRRTDRKHPGNLLERLRKLAAERESGK